MKQLDQEGLLRLAASKETEALLKRVFEWRNQVFQKNEFVNDQTILTLDLAGLTIHVKVSNAFSAVETFQELFLKKGHCQIPQFSPQCAATVLDIGANQGFYSMRMAHENPHCRIIAFEPNPLEFELFEMNLRKNQFGDRIAARNVAIGSSSGTLRMEIVPEIGPIGGVRVREPARKWLKDEFVKEIEVPALSLDDVFSQYQLDWVDILKMDIEGLEGDVLRNFHQFSRVGKIVVEFHSVQGRAELIDMMRVQGFNLVHEDVEPGDYYGDLYFLRPGPSD